MNDLSSMDLALTRKLNEVILANLENEHFGVKELARETGMSRFNLNRKLHFICQKTINQYIREIRLQRAKEMLQQEPVTAAEVSFKVGFSSPAYFSTCFSEQYGYPPGEVKKRGIISTGENREGHFQVPFVKKQGSEQNGTKPIILTKTGIQTIALVSFLILLSSVLFYFKVHIPENLNFRTGNPSNKHKTSIAVLPFINDSQDQDNEYFINGVMEAILDNLAKINDLDVRPRTSVEHYRNNDTKTIPQIARELGVNYIIEGSGQKIGDQVSLYIQLIEAGSDRHLFSNRYNMKLEDIFELQSEIAIKVASEIKALITSEEQELIEKRPTTNIEALNLFLQANDIHNIANSKGNWELDVKAEGLYKRAIQLDSTFAEPYTALGWIIFYRNIDSAFYLVNKALQFNAKNAEAYILKGYIYWNKGLEKEAEEAYLLSLKYRPNNSTAFRFLGELYYYQGRCYRAIETQLQAFRQENNFMQQRGNVESFCSSLYSLGFYEEGGEYAETLLELDNDSSDYFWGLATVDLDLGNFESALESALKMYACDTESVDNIYSLFYTYLYLRDFKEADLLLQKYSGIMKQQGRKIGPDYLVGFAHYQNGNKEEADFHFNETIKQALYIIEQNQPSASCRAYLTLAKIHSVRNEKKEALEWLQKVTDCMDFTIFRIKDYKNCSMFDNIRHEPGFKEYLMEAESRYRAEHEKVKQLLLEQGVL